jgi:kynureninase
MGTHPSPDGSGYFLYHSIGLYPDKAARSREALARIATAWGTPDDGQWQQSLATRNEFLELWRQFIGAPAGTMTTAANVTTAVYSIIGALPGRYLEGRKLLIAADCFPSLHFLLSGMAKRRGFTLHTVPLRAGETWVRDEDVIAQWTPEVGVALLTWVTSTASHRCDLRALIDHGHARGSLVGVDITQGVGILPLDARSAGADFLVSTSLKWLCGVAGAGVMQLREELLRECAPELRGWFSQEDIFSWALDRFDYARDARRFDHGTPSILGCAACIPALQWHAQRPLTALLAHNRALTAALIEGCTALGLALVSPPAAENRGGSVMFRLPAGVIPAAVVDGLRAQAIFTDCRGSTLRLSPGNLTTREGVGRLLRALPPLLKAS